MASCICFLIMPAVLPGSWHLAVPPHVCHLSQVKAALCNLVSSVVALIMRMFDWLHWLGLPITPDQMGEAPKC